MALLPFNVFSCLLNSHQKAEENTAKVADLLSLLQSFQSPFWEGSRTCW